jgi:SNF2 family DNA or RNA helicase
VLEPLRDRFIHADPLGSGKTPVGLRWLQAQETQRALLVVPSNVVRQWERQAKIWFPELDVVAVPKGSTKKQRLAAREYVAQADGPVAYVTNYALFREDQAALVAGGWDTALFDEAHRLKGRTSLLHKAATMIARRVKNIDLVTGSPILNSAEETWSLLHLIDPYKWRSFWRWAGEHFYIEQTTFYGKLPRPITRIVGPKPGALEAIRDELGPLLVMRDESEVLPDLEAAEHIYYELDMSPAERRLYDSMLKKSWLQTDDGDVVFAPNQVSKITRLRQLASDWSSVLGEQEKPGTKVLAVLELLEDILPQQAVIFVNFRSAANLVLKVLTDRAIAAAAIHGGIEEHAREAVKESFIAGDIKVLVATYGAAAEGVDGLQHAAHHVILLDHDWVPEIVNQAIGRLRRDGQRHKVIVHHFSLLDTVDQTVAAAHESKQEVADIITGRRLREVLRGQVPYPSGGMNQ